MSQRWKFSITLNKSTHTHTQDRQGPDPSRHWCNRWPLDVSTFTFTHKVELNSFAVLDKRGNWRKGRRGSNRGDGRRHEGGRLNGVFQESEAVLWMCCSGSRWTQAQFSASVHSVTVSPVKWRVSSTYLICKPTVSFVCWFVQPLTELRRQLKLIPSVLHLQSVSFFLFWRRRIMKLQVKHFSRSELCVFASVFVLISLGKAGFCCHCDNYFSLKLVYRISSCSDLCFP